MSVIMGYKTKDKIYLAADNRTVTLDGTLSRDDVDKIVVINNDVAVAFAGCNKTQMLFEILINKTRKEDFKVEDALGCIKKVYRICKILWFKKFAKEILELGSRMLVAGKNKKGDFCIYTVSFLHGKLEKPSLEDRFIFPPYDADAKTCWNIFATNAVNHQRGFLQRIIKDISKISKVISPTGDIWTYDSATDASTLEHFS